MRMLTGLLAMATLSISSFAENLAPQTPYAVCVAERQALVKAAGQTSDAQGEVCKENWIKHAKCCAQPQENESCFVPYSYIQAGGGLNQDVTNMMTGFLKTADGLKRNADICGSVGETSNCQTPGSEGAVRRYLEANNRLRKCLATQEAAYRKAASDLIPTMRDTASGTQQPEPSSDAGENGETDASGSQGRR